MAQKNSYLLSYDVVPTAYNIFLKVLPNEFTFHGFEHITVDIKAPTRTIVLHAVDLHVQKSVSICPAYSEEVIAEAMFYDKDKETLVLLFPNEIPVGEAEIGLVFDGVLSEKMRGFYRTQFEINGVTQWGAATQFEATDARRAFPCFDQPDMKAKFSISIQAPQDLVVLSNMPQRGEETICNGTKIVEFKETPPMSTYYLAFVVGNFEYIESKDKNGIPIRVWTTPGKKEWGRAALQCALHTLPYYAEKYGVVYPLPKVDMIAIPDFEAGAMENWGLVTYRETALLIDPKNDSISARQRVAEVVDHELGHFWKGDLTTMKWWDDLWLNEGFATWLASYAMDHQFPEWDVWTDFVAMELGRAFEEDALRSSKAIQVHIENPSEINEAFGAIAYSKGASVIRMIHAALGDNVFFTGLNLFMQRHQYANAETADLWQAFEDVSSQPVGRMMRGFTEQPGYPVVSVRLEEKEGGFSVLHVTQKRFLSDGGEDEQGMLWEIPITVRLENGKTISVVLKNASRSFIIPHPGAGWIKVNPGHTGYYIVAYSEDLQRRLNGGVVAGSLPDVDCIGMLSDNILLAEAGCIPTTQLFESFLAYKNKRHDLIWSQIAGAISWVKNILYQHAKDADEFQRLRNMLNEFGISLLGPMYELVGWDEKKGESDKTKMLRSTVLLALGSFSYQPVVERARECFLDHVEQRELLHPDYRPIVYKICAMHGSRDTWEQLRTCYETTDDHRERENILSACGAFNESTCIDDVMAFAMSDMVRPQDKYTVFCYLGKNSYARARSWKFVKDNWEQLKKWYERTHPAARLNEVTVEGFATEGTLRDVENFFATHTMEGSDRARERALERIRAKILWCHTQAAEVVAWLKKNAAV
jgi:puromycin-sensitive aminopeptidase